MEASQPNLHTETVMLSQASMSILPSSQKEEATQDPTASFNSLECKKAIAAIQKDYNLHKWSIDRYCKALHKHGWDLQKALEELLKCTRTRKKKDDFMSGRIKEILERIKHDLQLIYVPELVSKLEDAKQSSSKEPLYSSQTVMKNFKCKRTRMKNLSELDIKLNKGKEKIETADVKKSKVVKSETPDKENEVKILEVKKVLYQFHLYNLSHLLSVASSGGIFFKPLTHDLIIETLKMISEREKLSSLENPSSVATLLSTVQPQTERDHSVLLCDEVSTMASSLLSKIDSYLVASDSAQNKYSDAFTKSWTRSTGTSEVAQLDLELKWMYFGKVFQTIHNKLHADPVSIQSANEVEMIVDSKLLHGNFDFSDNCAVLSIIGALKRYVQMVRISCGGSRKWQINEMRRSIMRELNHLTVQLELNVTEVRKKVVDIAKIQIRAQTRVSSIKHCLDRAIALQTHISDFQSRISMYVKHLVIDLGQAQKESLEMRARHQHAAQLAEGILVQLIKKTGLHKNKLCARLGDLKHNAEEVLTIQEKELHDLVFVILSTKVEEEK